MPSIGDIRDSGDAIDVVSIYDNGNGIGNGQAYDFDNGNDIKNESGNENLNYRLQEINNIPEKRISVDELIKNLAGSGNVKQMKLASELMDLDLIEGNTSENLGPDCFDKISANKLSENLGLEHSGNNAEQAINTGNEDNSRQTDMEWPPVTKNKRNRSCSNESVRTRLETSVSPNKKHKSDKSSENVRKNRVSQGKSNGNSERTPLNKESVLVIISDIPDNTYFNAIKMENMILASFPRLKESGMWTKYRVNKRHKNKCYVTLPKDHHKDNVADIIKSQSGFQKCKVDIKLGINDVPSKAYKVVAIGVHQSISDEEIIQELGKSNVKVNKVQRLKFKGNPTQKVVLDFDKEQDMRIALFSGIYFGRIRIRCEPFRPTPPVTQCYQCQGFNHVAKDSKSKVQCMRCAGPHKSSECKEKDKDSFNPKCTNCSGNHVAASRECPKFKEQFKKQTEKVKARQEKLQNSLIVRGVSFSNIVKTNTDKVESKLSEKIQINKQETKQELDNVALKLEEKLEESFNQLSGKLVSFMVQSTIAIYETLDKKNADKVYNILSKESMECFNIELERVSPPLSPAPSVDTSATPTVGKPTSQPTKNKKSSNSGLTNRDIPKQRQAARAQNYLAPRFKSHHNIRK